MFRRVGKHRSYGDNIRLASFLSATAGIVNVASLMAFYVLTTNVTGHMAILSEELNRGHWYQVFVLAFWLLMFALGAFISSFFTIVKGRKNPKKINYLIVSFEILLLCFVALYGLFFFDGRLKETELLAAILLFAMGLQNALVTTISNAYVRTTHLTGMFTDLGIDLASIFKTGIDKKDLTKRLNMRFTIIFFYFIGGLLGGHFFLKYGFGAFFLAGFILFLSISYDWFKLKYYKTILFMKRNRQYGMILNPSNPMNRVSLAVNSSGISQVKIVSQSLPDPVKFESTGHFNEISGGVKSVSVTKKQSSQIRTPETININSKNKIMEQHANIIVNGNDKVVAKSNNLPSGVSGIKIVPKNTPDIISAERVKKKYPGGISGISIIKPNGEMCSVADMPMEFAPKTEKVATLQKNQDIFIHNNSGTTGVSKVKIVSKDTPDPVREEMPGIRFIQPSGISNVTIIQKTPSGFADQVIGKIILEPIALNKDITVGEAIEKLDGNNMQYIPVVDSDNILTGMLERERIENADKKTILKELIREEVVAVEDGIALSDAEKILIDYDIKSLPIINKKGVLKGIIHI
jgi:uncharacterized membrane protein YoaK (UPF0700 family)/CBS domain-containing protein